MTLVKICGIRELEHARVAAEAGADLLGFVFVPVRRQIAPGLAAEIVSTIRSEFACPPAVVGLFVNETPDFINRIAERVDLDFVQLSGDEPHELARDVSRTVIKAVRIRDASSADEARKSVRAHLVSSVAVLIDSHVPGHWGGTGVVGDWATAANLAEEFPVILAGGLTSSNVAEAIRSVRPAAVDVSSGVEIDGHKDSSKIFSFIQAARNVDAQPSASGVNLHDLFIDRRMHRQSCSGVEPMQGRESQSVRSST